MATPYGVRLTPDDEADLRAAARALEAREGRPCGPRSLAAALIRLGSRRILAGEPLAGLGPVRAGAGWPTPAGRDEDETEEQEENP